MTDELETLAGVLAAANSWKQAADKLLEDRLAHQQAYEALSQNLVGVVSAQMEFEATIDPDDAAPTNVDGGTFNTIVEAVNAAPAGGRIVLDLLAGKTYDFTSALLKSRSVEIRKSGAGDNPVIRPLAQVYLGTHNILGGFALKADGGVYLKDIDFDFTAAKADLALPWNTTFRNFVRWNRGTRVDVSMQGGVATAGADVTAIADCLQTGIVNASFYNCTLDGNIFGVQSVGEFGGIALVAHSGVTLSNGAALVDNTAGLGSNLLMS